MLEYESKAKSHKAPRTENARDISKTLAFEYFVAILFFLVYGE